MENRRKQEIGKCLKQIQSHSYYMARALRRNDAQGEEMALRSIQSELELTVLLYEDLQKLRGK